MKGVTGGVKKLTDAELAQQDQFEAEFERSDFAPWAMLISLSKSDAARWSKPKMAAFLACLDRWTKRRAADGYEIRSEPLEGPGTMQWRAVKR